MNVNNNLYQPQAGVGMPPQAHGGPSPQMLTLACRTGNMAQVMFAVQQGARADAQTLDVAVGTKNPQIVQAVIAAGAFPSAETLTNAYKSCSKEILDMIVTQGARPNHETFSTALLCSRAIDRNFEPLIQLAHDLGAEQDEFCLDHAIKGGSYKWTAEILKTCTVGPGFLKTAYDNAAQSQLGYDLDIFELLLDNGVKADPANPYLLNKIVDNRGKGVSLSAKLLKKALDAGAKPDDHTLSYHMWSFQESTLFDTFYITTQQLIDAGGKVTKQDIDSFISTRYPIRDKYLGADGRAEKSRVTKLFYSSIPNNAPMQRKSRFK